jgi:hypothetical protein
LEINATDLRLSAALKFARRLLSHERDSVASRLQKRSDEGAADSREHAPTAIIFTFVGSLKSRSPRSADFPRLELSYRP